EEEIYPEFVQETLGALIQYDQKNGTDYLKILEAYFENDCSILHTAEKLYCHKNTLTYKLNKIKELLGYDILTNENRMKVMISFHLLKMGT
ncbi:MAG: helix-turn-helix domain-containing protein, partial [Dorea sp.]